MKIIKSYFTGLIEATLRPKMIFLLWAVNFFFSSSIYFLVSGMWNDILAWSGTSESLIHKMDYYILTDALFHHGEQMSTVLIAGLILIVLYFPVSLFFKGGILHTLRQPQPVHPEDIAQKFLPRFFQGGGKYFGRFFRLWIFSLILWVAFIFVNIVLTSIGKLLTADGTNERMIVAVFIARIAVALFLALLIKMILDYARIKIVVEERIDIYRSFLVTLKFVFHNLGKTLILFYLLFLTAIALTAALFLLKSGIPTSTLGGAVLAFAVGQVLIYLRSWSNVTFQAGQLQFYA